MTPTSNAVVFRAARVTRRRFVPIRSPRTCVPTQCKHRYALTSAQVILSLRRQKTHIRTTPRHTPLCSSRSVFYPRLHTCHTQGDFMSKLVTARIPAAALSLALGVSIVAVPQVTEPVHATAQEATQGHVLSPKSVTFAGITDKDGNKVSGEVQSLAHSRYGTDKTGTVIADNGDFTFNFNIDVADAQAGDRLYIQPTTTYTPKYGAKAGTSVESHWIGTRVIGNVPNRPLELNGKRIGTVDIIHGGGIRVTFNDAAEEFKSGSVSVKATAHSWDAYEDTLIEGDRSANEGPLHIKVDSFTPDDYKNPRDTNVIPTDINTKFMSYQQSTGAARNRAFSGTGDVSPQGEARLKHTKYQAPAGADYEVKLTANRKAEEKKAAWLMTRGDIKHSVTLYKYDDEGRELEHTTNPDTIKQWAPDMDIQVSKSGDTVTIKATGVPDNYQPIINITPTDGGPLGVASYQPNASFVYVSEYTPLDETARTADAQQVTYNMSRIAPVADMPENDGGKAYTRTGTVTPMIAGQPKNVGTEVPAPVAGTKQTFEFEVHNTGDTYMAAPEVTLPNGETKIVPGVKIGPNETGVVQVDYDVPKDATRLDFGVDFPRYTLNTTSHTFRIGPVDNSAKEAAEAAKKQQEELEKQTAELKKQNAALEKQAKELAGIKDQLDKSNKLTEETNKKLQSQIDATKDQTKKIEGQLKKLNDVQERELKELIRQSKALEKTNEILLNQYRAQLKQWKIENAFAKDEQDDRHHSSKLGRCISTDPALPLMILIPAGLVAAFNMPGMDGLVKSAGDQIGRMNMDIQRATGINNAIPADIQSAINSFNHNYGDAVTTGAITLGGLAAAVGAAIGINNLMNNCFDEADDEVGRERTPHTKLEDSAVLPREDETAADNAAEGSAEGSSAKEDAAA